MDHKSHIRERVFTELRKVALPDSRFHFDFGEYITDFVGSHEATERLRSHEAYRSASTVFITPDNCLEELRLKALRDGKKVLMTTYSIRRGFWLLDPSKIEPDRYEIAALLDAMEKYGRQVTLQEIKKERVVVDLLVTGTGAINHRGIRFGKGHGFFDLEWAMLSEISALSPKATTMAIVHDCQVLWVLNRLCLSCTILINSYTYSQEELQPEIFDTVCDLVITPTRILEASQGARKPTCGVLWDNLQPNMLNDIPPLRELQEMQRS